MTRSRSFPSVLLAVLLLAACGQSGKWHSVDISGSLPPLAFTMTRASDGKTVTAAGYRGRIVLLYFGYTYCPDVCPTTLTNIAQILDRLGPDAHRVSVLFVTVDPNRDTLAGLKSYTRYFAPEIDGLRGTDDQIAALARRYRVVYSVTPKSKDGDYEVTHSEAVYVFDADGAARLLVPSLASQSPDITGASADLKRLADGARPGLLARLERAL